MPERTVWRGDSTLSSRTTCSMHAHCDGGEWTIRCCVCSRTHVYCEWFTRPSSQRFRSRDTNPFGMGSHKANIRRWSEIVISDAVVYSVFHGEYWIANATAENVYWKCTQFTDGFERQIRRSGCGRFYLQRVRNAYLWTRYSAVIL